MTDEDLIPFLAIGLFAGIRPMEIQRLSWKDISGQYIEVSAGKSKTRQRRLVEVLPSLSSWLQLGGELPARNKRKRLTALVAKCGLEWHQDIMRHSFAICIVKVNPFIRQQALSGNSTRGKRVRICGKYPALI